MGVFSYTNTGFQSTPLIRGATWSGVPFYVSPEFQSTPLIRGATCHAVRRDVLLRFQSTPLIRGATCALPWRPRCSQYYFNPRPSYEERHGWFERCEGRNLISIHAPHTRSDVQFTEPDETSKTFQSTPLIRGATTSSDGYLTTHDFNPRPSYEERRPSLKFLALLRENFNPRPSYEERHGFAVDRDAAACISIHAPHTRSDPPSAKRCSWNEFQSTPLIRGATTHGNRSPTFRSFQSTPLIRGATILREMKDATNEFQSTPLIRGATSRRS